jgi:hypothetical protein
MHVCVYVRMHVLHIHMIVSVHTYACIYSFTCTLFNDAFSVTQTITSNEKVTSD